MTDRIFTLTDPDLISCNISCSQEFAIVAEPSKSLKTFKDVKTRRCVANGAALRGQHFKATEHPNLNACRACTIYTSVDNPPPQV